MTVQEKTEISTLRSQGLGYKKIGQLLGISVDTIKTFCRRNNISGSPDSFFPREDSCLTCGKAIVQIPGRKKKKFCTDKCRNQWWNSHLDKVNRKATYHFTCLFCKKAFTVYGNSRRKYCCHQCYIEDRFGEARHG